MAATTPYASVADVRLTLGEIGSEDRLPDEINLDGHVATAHAEALDRLSDTYGVNLPAFAGDGAEAIRWAEAKLAAADVLDLLRSRFGDDSLVAERLRTSARTTLDRGVPGYRPGAVTGPDDGDPTTPLPYDSGKPRHSSAAVSVFADPYLDGVLDPYPRRVASADVIALPFGTDTSGYPDGTTIVFYDPTP